MNHNQSPAITSETPTQLPFTAETPKLPTSERVKPLPSICTPLPETPDFD